MNHYAIASNLTWMTTLALIVFVLLKGRRNRLVTGFCLYMLSIAAWSFCLSRLALAPDLASGLFWGRALHMGAILVPIAFLHFSLVFQTDVYAAKWRPVVRLGYGIALFFLSVSFSKYFVPFTKAASGMAFYPQPGPLYLPFVIWFVIYVDLAFWALSHAYTEAVGLKKTQLRYAIIAYAFAYIGGGLTFLPVFGFSLTPIVMYGVPICMCILTYAVFVHGLMDVVVIIRNTMIYSAVTGILVAIMIFVAMISTHIMEGFLGHSNLVTYAVTACFITIIFHPLRLRVQAFVDLHFFRGWEDREVVRQVAAGFSHELKSPLAGLSLQVQTTLARMEEIENSGCSLSQALPEIKADLRHLLNKTMDAARRIDAVRGVAEPSGGQIGPVDVSSVLDSGLATLEYRLGEGRDTVRKDLPHNLPAVHSNEKQLEIVFINLMKNALEAMEGVKSDQPHMLSLRGFEQNGSVMVSVKDTGAGISGRDVGRVFEPYFTTKGRRGTGMGLYLSQQIIKAHGGTIEVKSEEGKGTEFIVRLPKYLEKRAANF